MTNYSSNKRANQLIRAPLAVWEGGKNGGIKSAVTKAAKHGADAVSFADHRN
jgi:hypothetical protein